MCHGVISVLFAGHVIAPKHCGDLIEKQEILMQTWANYCYPSGEKVIQMPTVKTAS